MYTSPIVSALELAFSSYPVQVFPVLSVASRAGGGDFQCNSVLQLAGRMRVKPLDMAREIAAKLELEGVCAVTVTAPGYLNFVLDPDYVARCANGEVGRSFARRSDNPKSIVIDFGGPNIAKALHVGHLRSFVIGESLRRILSAVGHTVVSDIHYGDWGLPVGKLILGIETSIAETVKAGGSPDLRWTLEDLGAFYRQGNELCKSHLAYYEKAKDNTLRLQAGDRDMRALWKRVREISLKGIEGHISMLGAHFDTLDGESDVDSLIPDMLDDLATAGLAVESDGALVGPVVGDDSLPPVLLRKSDGSSLYGTTDLATIVDRIAKYAPDMVVYCVDGRQDVHLKTCFILAEKASAASVPGFSPLPKLVHAAFGTVNDASGKPYSTREGKPALLEDLIGEAIDKARQVVTDGEEDTARQVAVAALKFADLSTDRRSGYVFDPERMMSFTGRTGPYVQYARARINSLLRKAAADGYAGSGAIRLTHPADRDLALAVLGLPTAISEAAEELQARSICEAAYRIAVAVSRLYSDTEILRAPGIEREGRLALLDWAGSAIEEALALLGIGVPERM
jgi:arginyl-tRNA synthetase|nr:arginine--tRNA ligase [Neorhizobium tomejilense]